MTDTPPLPSGIDALLALLEPAAGDAGAENLSNQLLDCIALLVERDDPGTAGLERLMRALHLRLMQDRLPARAALARAQFMVQHYRADSAETERLQGEAAAMGLLLAQALNALPRRRAARIFDAAQYLAQNSDVAEAGRDPLQHYLASGASEGRRPAELGGARPVTLAALCASPQPLFLDQYPAALRHEMLAAVQAARPRVSVILPSWNRAHMLGQAVTSALLQSYAPSEVIVADDGSTDGTGARLRAQFPEALAEGRLVLLDLPHGGVSAARNAGLARAQGEVIAYLDSDNQWDPDHLLTACAALCDPATDSGAGREAVYTALCRHNLSDGWSDILYRPFDRAALEADNFIDLNSFVHKRGLYDRLGGFDTGLARLVDWDLILRYTACNPALGVPVVTGHYVLARTALGNISEVEPLAPNLARIRAKLAGETP